MENITKINKNIYRLTIPYKDIFTTAYLIKTPMGAILFDVADTDEDVENYIIPFLKEIGITSNMLKCVFVSHNHRDHAGGLQKFMQEFSNVCILSRSEILKDTYKGYKFISPNDNDVFLDVLQVITIPGHTEDSSALLDLRTKTLITGDCLQLYGIFGSEDWACNITLPAEHFDALKKVRNMDINDIYMAHNYHPGGYKAHGRDEINRVIDACIEPLMYIKNIILDNPTLEDVELRSIYNNSADIPTVKTRVIEAMREALNVGRIK